MFNLSVQTSVSRAKLILFSLSSVSTLLGLRDEPKFISSLLLDCIETAVTYDNEKEYIQRESLHTFLKQYSSSGVLQMKCFQNFRQIHTKASVPQSKKVSGFLLKKENPAQVFSYQCCLGFKNTFLKNTFKRLFLSINFLFLKTFSTSVLQVYSNEKMFHIRTTYDITFVCLSQMYCALKMSKFPQCHRQPQALQRHFERFVP